MNSLNKTILLFGVYSAAYALIDGIYPIIVKCHDLSIFT